MVIICQQIVHMKFQNKKDSKDQEWIQLSTTPLALFGVFKKQQNLKILSAANLRWCFRG